MSLACTTVSRPKGPPLHRPLQLYLDNSQLRLPGQHRAKPGRPPSRTGRLRLPAAGCQVLLQVPP